MRIGFDVAQTCETRAGCGWHADSLAKALHRVSPNNELILYHQFGSWINRNIKRGTQIHGVPSPLYKLGYKEAQDLWISIERGRTSPPGNPDIVHSNSFMAPRTSPVPLVYTIHDLCFWTHHECSAELNRALCQTEMLRALRAANAFVFVSQASMDDFERVLPNWITDRHVPTKVIHSAPRLKPTQPIDSSQKFQSEKAPWICIGTLEPRKNVGGLLDAYELYYKESQLHRPLVLAGGKGWHSDNVHKRIQKLSETLPIKYLGYVSDEELIETYQSGFCHICPSHYEGFGLPVIEAMSFGLPVISNHIPSVKEFASDFAQYADFAKPEEVAEIMLNLESNSQSYDEWASNSEARSKEYTWDRTAEQLIQFYGNILNKSE